MNANMERILRVLRKKLKVCDTTEGRWVQVYTMGV